MAAQFLDPGEIRASQVLFVTISCVSVVSAAVAFYWFIRMKRTFRHDLIMLLIQSDMLRALWLMIFSIVEFTYGPISSQSSFCQLSGFFLSVGMEASDVAVLMIALHAGVWILRPDHKGGGLYPYRRVVLAIWLVLPVVLASLAFASPLVGYVNTGYLCWLPHSPLWPRLVLSWGPRWLIWIAIFVIYGYINYYVSGLLTDFGTTAIGLTVNATGTSAPPKPSRPLSVLPSPSILPVDRHGTFLSSASPRMPSATSIADPSSARSHSDRPDTVLGLASPPASSASRTQWRWHRSSLDSALKTQDREHISSDSQVSLLRQCENSISIPPLVHAHSSRLRPKLVRSRLVRAWSDPVLHSIHADNTAPIVQHNPGDSGNSSADLDLSLSGLPSSVMVKSRDRIRRQIRLLMVYPIVYVLLWIAPLVGTLLAWIDPSRITPIPLVIINLGSLSAQAAVNAWLFCIRERPWRRPASPYDYSLPHHDLYTEHQDQDQDPSRDNNGPRAGGWSTHDDVRTVEGDDPLRKAPALQAHSVSIQGMGGLQRAGTVRASREWWDADERVISENEDQ